MNENNSTKPTRILVVDDDFSQRSLLESFLSKQGYSIVTAASGEEALTKLDAEAFDMMISDVRMPGISGLEALRQARQAKHSLPVLLVTAYPDIRDAVGAMQDGAANYLEKPIDLGELLSLVRRLTGAGENSVVFVLDDVELPETVIANSPQMLEVFRDAALVASSETRVLLTGDSGVGKEVVAEMIHAWSPRHAGSLVKVNCAAIPETLLESELFGHEKGAFTGAISEREGHFERAGGGTILLDEIGEMSPSLQAKLLQITQDGTFQRLGSKGDRKTDARILASTNRNLEKEVQEGRFREDLFFRLNVMEIYVPPLRERNADIVPLANLFASKFSGGRPRLSAAVITCLELYDWPGNVRELSNAMERATLMARGELILPEHLPKRVQNAGFDEGDESGTGRKGHRIEDVERAVILQALRENNFNRTETARALGISRRALIYKLRRFKEQGHVVEKD